MASTISATDARDQFMHLMVTQLQNQNPLEPTSQEDFLSQLSQFSMLEGVERMNLNFSEMLKMQELSQGADLVGKTVEFASSSGTQRGVVREARIVDGEMKLNVDGKTVPLNDVLAVVQAA